MGVLVVGDRAFQDRGFLGVGVPSYSRRQGYTPYEIPTAVGARYFGPEKQAEFDDETDKALPIAQGNKWDGGRPEYQRRVLAAAKKGGTDLGFSKKDIAEFEKMPGVRQVA